MTKLELIYLMKVSLHFETYQDTYNFIQINKKCYETTLALKRNPFYFYHTSDISFLKHFSIDTMYSMSLTPKTVDLLSNITYLRYPTLSPNFPEKLIDSLCQKICPKIQAISLQNDLFGKYCIKHAKLFEKLIEMKGDAEMILQFLNEYTDNGKEYVNFPKKYYISQCDGEILIPKDETINTILQLRKTIPNSDEINFHVQFGECFHNRKEIKLLKRIDWHVKYMNSKLIDYIHDNYGSKRYKFRINAMKDTPQLNCFNNLISKGQYHNIVIVNFIDKKDIEFDNSFEEEENIDDSFSFELGDDDGIDGQIGNDIEFIEEMFERVENEEKDEKNEKIQKELEIIPQTKENTVWNIPNCVEILQLHSCLSFTQFTCQTIRKLVLNDCHNINFKQSFPQLKEIVCNSSDISSLEFDSEVHLTFVLIIDCASIHFKFAENKSHSIERIVIDKSEDIVFESKKCEYDFVMKTIDINDSRSIQLPFFAINSLEHIEISGCKDIEIDSVKKLHKFFSNDKLKRETLLLLMDTVFVYPNTILPELDFMSFVMRPFYSLSPSIEIKENKIRCLQHNDKDNNYLLSSNFFSLENFQINNSNNLSSKIRYFEITFESETHISIGLVHHTYEILGELMYHNSEGEITLVNNNDNELLSSIVQQVEPNGNNIKQEKTVIGCGYNTQTDDAFFTINGKKIFSTQLKWNYICAYIRLYWFSEISINYGKIPFVFDVSSLI